MMIQSIHIIQYDIGITIFFLPKISEPNNEESSANIGIIDNENCSDNPNSDSKLDSNWVTGFCDAESSFFYVYNQI